MVHISHHDNVLQRSQKVVVVCACMCWGGGGWGVNNTAPTLIAQSLLCIFIVACESLERCFISVPTHPAICLSTYLSVLFGLAEW